MATIFSKIVRGEIPCHKVAETDRYFAFLDINPLMPGHTLVIPKSEVDYLFDLPDEELTGLILFAKKVAKAIEKATGVPRCGLAVMGLEVPHAHIHLGPLKQEKDFQFGHHRTPPTEEELAQMARAIREAYEQI